jgi:putative FmdB family regulatory protein
MPIYRYRCTQCAEIAEVWAKMSDSPPDECPKCGANALEKMVARTGFQLKGGGWYAQGYGGSTGESTTESTGDSGGSSESTSTTSDD